MLLFLLLLLSLNHLVKILCQNSDVCDMNVPAGKNAFLGGIKAIFQMNFTTCLGTCNLHIIGIIQGNYLYMHGHLVLCTFSLCLS
jgi:hypothetical protein